MGEQRHYRRPSQHKRRPPQTVMPCGSEDTPERQSEHRAETEKQPPRQPRKRLVQKPTPKSRQNPPEQWAKWRGQALDSAKQCAKRGAKRAERGLLQAQLAVTRAKRRAERRKQKKQAEQDSYLGAFSVGGLRQVLHFVPQFRRRAEGTENAPPEPALRGDGRPFLRGDLERGTVGRLWGALCADEAA